MSNFICPKCKTGFSKEGNSYKCANGHCFDISRKGTVNLLLSQKSRHGDDKLMVNARRKLSRQGVLYSTSESGSGCCTFLCKRWLHHT